MGIRRIFQKEFIRRDKCIFFLIFIIFFFEMREKNMKTNQNWLYYLHKKMHCGYLQYNMVVYTTLLMVVEIHKQNKAQKNTNLRKKKNAKKPKKWVKSVLMCGVLKKEI
jgi:hypothetical protein